MHILLTNDDGIEAKGIQVLAEILAKKHRLTVVAPSDQRSAVGQSISIWAPLRVDRRDYMGFPGYAVKGTPADCAKLGVYTLAPDADLVISGINDGANCGTEIFYSGTVAAAREAAFQGKPAMAVSLVDGREFKDPAFIAQVVFAAIDEVMETPLSKGRLLNINIPDLLKENIKGIRAVPMAWTNYSETYVEHEVYPGYPWYWPKYNPSGSDQGIENDVNLAHSGYVTLTPIQWDLTDHEDLRRFKKFDKLF